MEKNNEAKIEEILTRGVGEFIDPDGSFKKKLIAKAEGKYPGEIIIKYGVDPTRPDIHLGHAVCFRKLRQLQDLGCKIVFLIGDFTAQIGDPTGKDKIRPELHLDEVKRNVMTYLRQVDKVMEVEKNQAGEILDSNKFSWIPNSDWLYSLEDLIPEENTFAAKLEQYQRTRMQKVFLNRQEIQNITLRGFLWTLKHITHAQLIQRDMFDKRLKEKREIYMHELMYPVLQGIDSYVINLIYGSCDLELGGTDQTFNMLMGRTVQKVNKGVLKEKKLEMDEQSIISLKILEGLDGKEKMSKSLDNYIGITEELNSMFGKVMSIPDTSIINYFELCTDVPLKEIKQLGKEMKDEKVNPRDLKLRLAEEIVKIYHGESEAEKAKEYFVNTFSKKEMPADIAEIKVNTDSISLLDFIVLSGNAKSKGEARRKVEQGGVEIDGKRVEDWKKVLDKKDSGRTLKIGKFSFAKIIFI